MADVERDSTQDWLLPEAARPGTMLELEQRVDVALSVARSAEAAALEIGAAAFDAAAQARRAAEFAERAVTGKVTVEPLPEADSGDVGTGDAPAVIAKAKANGATGVSHDERLQLFSERADRVMMRLRALDPVA